MRSRVSAAFPRASAAFPPAPRHAPCPAPPPPPTPPPTPPSPPPPPNRRVGAAKSQRASQSIENGSAQVSPLFIGRRARPIRFVFLFRAPDCNGCSLLISSARVPPFFHSLSEIHFIFFQIFPVVHQHLSRISVATSLACFTEKPFLSDIIKLPIFFSFYPNVLYMFPVFPGFGKGHRSKKRRPRFPGRSLAERDVITVRPPMSVRGKESPIRPRTQRNVDVQTAPQHSADTKHVERNNADIDAIETTSSSTAASVFHNASVKQRNGMSRKCDRATTTTTTTTTTKTTTTCWFRSREQQKKKLTTNKRTAKEWLPFRVRDGETSTWPAPKHA